MVLLRNRILVLTSVVLLATANEWFTLQLVLTIRLWPQQHSYSLSWLKVKDIVRCLGEKLPFYKGLNTLNRCDSLTQKHFKARHWGTSKQQGLQKTNTFTCSCPSTKNTQGKENNLIYFQWNSKSTPQGTHGHNCRKLPPCCSAGTLLSVREPAGSDRISTPWEDEHSLRGWAPPQLLLPQLRWAPGANWNCPQTSPALVWSCFLRKDHPDKIIYFQTHYRDSACVDISGDACALCNNSRPCFCFLFFFFF